MNEEHLADTVFALPLCGQPPICAVTITAAVTCTRTAPRPASMSAAHAALATAVTGSSAPPSTDVSWRKMVAAVNLPRAYLLAQ